MAEQMLETTCFLALEPKFRRAAAGDLTCTGFKVAKATQNRSASREPVVKLRLRLPARAFAPLAPEVTIEVPEGSLSWPEPEVTIEAEPAS